jgi:hypothetical protein
MEDLWFVTIDTLGNVEATLSYDLAEGDWGEGHWYIVTAQNENAACEKATNMHNS